MWPLRQCERLVVWLGGVAFVSSLAGCAYSYVVLWAALDRPLVHIPLGTGLDHLTPGLPALVFDLSLLGLFTIHHSVFARDRVKRWLAETIAERVLRSVYVWTASVLLIIVCVLWQPIRGSLYRATGWLAVAHASIQLIGVLLIARSVSVIDALELAGIRRTRAVAPLQVTGPYRLVRHPVYLGWILALFGAAHMTGDRLAFATITTIYLVIAIPWEERSLVGTFGEEYERYQRQVKWRVVPFVY